jgi:hypothetical protein
MASISGIRPWLGVVLKELPRYTRALSSRDDGYLGLCNRNERLVAAPQGPGFRCDWQWTSDLHAPRVLPSLGRKLMQRALADHPIRQAVARETMTEAPAISFVIGHRGESRLPHLMSTLASIAGQQGVAVECVVVEQDVEARAASSLPAWVRYVHAPPPSGDMPYCRSWAFNVGVRQARGAVLVLHDNDMLVPCDYAANVVDYVRQGHELVNLKRFIFFLDESHSTDFFSGETALTGRPPLAIMQNAEGGGSIAITREGFDRIGGMDESFVGWGGEDNEFWERAQTLKVWPYGYMPLVHLWHAAQPGKHKADSRTLARHRELAAIPALARIAALQHVARGSDAGPVGWPSAGRPAPMRTP